MYKALNNSTYSRGPRTRTDTHTQKKMDAVGLYSVLPPRRRVQLGDQSLAGVPSHLVRSHRLQTTTVGLEPMTRSPRPWQLGHHYHEKPPQRTTDCSNHDHHCLPSSRFYHHSLEVRAISSFATLLPIGRCVSGGVSRRLGGPPPRRGFVVAFGTLASH